MLSKLVEIMLWQAYTQEPPNFFYYVFVDVDIGACINEHVLTNILKAHTAITIICTEIINKKILRHNKNR